MNEGSGGVGMGGGESREPICTPEEIRCSENADAVERCSAEGDSWLREECEGGTPVCREDECARAEVIQVTTGDRHSCVVYDDGSVKCWGRNSQGQIGDGGEEALVSSPVSVEIADVVQIEAGSRHTCALQKEGVVSCWGDDEYGQLGDGGVFGDQKLRPFESLISRRSRASQRALTTPAR